MPKKKSALSKIDDKIKASTNTNNNSVIEEIKQSPQKVQKPKKPKKIKTKKQTPISKINTQQKPILEETVIDYSEFEKELEKNEDILKEKENEQKRLLFSKISTIALIVGCVYIIFVIYGVLNTNYIYDDNGNVIPQKLTIEDISNINEFNSIADTYRQIRVLYEEILKLDYRVGAGIEDALLIAPEYEELLDTIEKITIQTQSVTTSSKYTQTMSMLLSWVQTDAAVYCQRMSEAITLNNSDYAQQAIKYREIMYNDFALITENLTTLGASIEGVNVSDMLDWSPESYIQENVGALD